MEAEEWRQKPSVLTPLRLFAARFCAKCADKTQCNDKMRLLCLLAKIGDELELRRCLAKQY